MIKFVFLILQSLVLLQALPVEDKAQQPAALAVGVTNPCSKDLPIIRLKELSKLKCETAPSTIDFWVSACNCEFDKRNVCPVCPAPSSENIQGGGPINATTTTSTTTAKPLSPPKGQGEVVPEFVQPDMYKPYPDGGTPTHMNMERDKKDGNAGHTNTNFIRFG